MRYIQKKCLKYAPGDCHQLPELLCGVPSPAQLRFRNPQIVPKCRPLAVGLCGPVRSFPVVLAALNSRERSAWRVSDRQHGTQTNENPRQVAFDTRQATVIREVLNESDP